MKETCGKITLKHLYEIAKIKSQDPPLEWRSLEEICTMLIATARTCGIEVVRELDAKVNKYYTKYILIHPTPLLFHQCQVIKEDCYLELTN